MVKPACRHGHVQHLEHLLFYGADMSAQNASGNTALHICALYNQTPLTLAAHLDNVTEVIKTLLELGASPDYKDSRGLTPLYHSVVACRHGHVQHLEHLLFYGADMSAQNASGNTALHICALYNQDNCARVLLARGADKEVKNYNSQSPFQLSEVCSVIRGPFQGSQGPFGGHP
ncbi:hypothetical protein CRUP_020255 [Coryphaenoides rupestris]|nr:hypothetical protein CRUP_020255 [Coryphaenoides rupestris]